MTIHQVLQLVHTNPQDEVIFFKEGSFRKCYNMHAFYFVQNVKQMKVSTRFFKNAQTYVHSIGFPDTSLAKYQELLQDTFGASVIETTPSYLRMKSGRWKSDIQYKVWRDTLIDTEIKKEHQAKQDALSRELLQVGAPCLPKEYLDLVKRIRAYPIEKATPLEAFNFLQKIKKYADECPLPEAV